MTGSWKIKLLLLPVLLMLQQTLSSQETYYKFRVQFTDKQNNRYSLDKPEEFLSQRALERRSRQSIGLDMRDLPVSQDYLDSISTGNLQILYTSKWLNAAVIRTTDSSLAVSLPSKPFISGVDYLYRSDFPLKSAANKFDETFSPDAAVSMDAYNSMEELPSDHQIEMLQGQTLHENNFLGQGMLIAQLDGGFANADTLAGLDSLFSTGRIVATRTYVEPDSSFFFPDNGSHGTNVLSIMGGEIPGQFRGCASKASFMLIQTEDVRTEFRIEEANWLAGAEFADSMGADIINTSLGYSIGFTDPFHNYDYSQMDGRSALVTKAAAIAARKGMIVVTSAGNSGRTTDPWGYITAPADADSVLAAGAVDEFGHRADFSSRGPSADGRVKPDVAAQGVLTWLIGSNGIVTRGNGTSFSSPVLAGLVACFWQSMPGSDNIEIINAIRQSSSLNPFPDSLYGYGIPNFALAGWIITGNDPNIVLPPGSAPVRLYPNPADDYILIEAQSGEFSCTGCGFRITDLSGRIIKTGLLNGQGRIELAGIKSGSYILNITGRDKVYKGIFIKR